MFELLQNCALHLRSRGRDTEPNRRHTRTRNRERLKKRICDVDHRKIVVFSPALHRISLALSVSVHLAH